MQEKLGPKDPIAQALSLKYWHGKTDEERKAHGAKACKARWADKSIEERDAFMASMRAKRLPKKPEIGVSKKKKK